MKITKIETFHCDGGWRPWTFVKVSTDKKGLVGWSECSDSHGSPQGIAGVIKDLKPLIVGEDPRGVERLFWKMYSRTRQASGGIAHKAIGSLENAMLDIKAKDLGVPVYELLGGLIRDKIPVYWSRCGTGRVRDWQFTGGKRLQTLGDIKTLGRDVKRLGFSAIKTNIVIIEKPPYVYMPGFAKSSFGQPELEPSERVLNGLDKYIAELRKAVGDQVSIRLDVNFNFRTEGYIRIGRMLEKYNIEWLEIDTADPKALLEIKRSIKIPVASCENLCGTKEFRPYLERHSVDVALIDIVWNGIWQAKKIADIAEAYEINVATHGYQGPLAPFISAQFAAAIPNFKILEVDVEDVPWKYKLVTSIPKIKDGYMSVSKAPGWGVEVNESELKKHKWDQKRPLI
jgi:galactonate dehydratase